MNGALAGIRVLDLSRLLPGPFCSLLLADHGADVIKVEDTGMGDYVRWAQPAVTGVEPSAASAAFLALNRGKRSIRLDLKTAAGRELLRALAAGADVLLEGFRPGVMDRLGVGHAALRAVNPRLVYCAISGYGQDGPLRARSGHDLNYLGLVGALALSGDAGGPPVQSAAQIADLGGGALFAAFGILAALRDAERTGDGAFVDVSMADGALSWLAMPAAEALATGQARRRGDVPLGGSLLCYRTYACRDGHVTLGALEPKFWQAFCAGVQRPDLVERQFDPPGSPAHAQVAAIVAARTRDEWAAFAAEHDCCLEPVLELDEALESPLTRERSMVVTIDQPGAERPVRQLASPLLRTDTPARPAPALGEHTDAILRELGHDDAAIAALHEQGVVAGPPERPAGAFMR